MLDFLQNAGSEFTYTTELIAARRDDDAHWGVGIRIEGNFPGNVADLDYRFTVIGDRSSGPPAGVAVAGVVESANHSSCPCSSSDVCE